MIPTIEEGFNSDGQLLLSLSNRKNVASPFSLTQKIDEVLDNPIDDESKDQIG